MEKSDKIFVAGHRGMVGSALARRLEAEGFSNVVTREAWSHGSISRCDFGVERASAEVI